ncbi:MAG: hypothetical protein ACYDBQ_00305 [Thermoplasmatota archaeon]
MAIVATSIVAGLLVAAGAVAWPFTGQATSAGHRPLDNVEHKVHRLGERAHHALRQVSCKVHCVGSTADPAPTVHGTGPAATASGFLPG